MVPHPLTELNRRLLELHRSLIAEQRRDYERDYGPVASAELFRLLLEHEQFAWLRSLSGLIARIDEALDADPPLTPAGADALLDHARRLFRPESEDDRFAVRYREALQNSPEVVMNHADVMRLLASRPPR